jgi:predicted acyltransferase
MEENTKMSKSARLNSLDALRGFDMFWIMGGEGLVCLVAALFGFPEFKEKFGHVAWEGLQFMDTIFPLFLFMAGVSFPFSAEKSIARGMTRGRVAAKALRRGVILMVLGIICWGFLKKLNFADFRIMSVLGYIGFGWMVAAWIYLAVRGFWARVVIAIAILTTVTLVFGFVSAPDAPADAVRFSPQWHLGCWLDRMILRAHSLHPMYDNEGFAGLLPTIVSAMLGMFAGDIVRAGGTKATGRKALRLLLSAVVCLVSGLALSTFYPVVKKLWSPSFVLIAGGYSYAVFALFYWLIDVKNVSRWSFFFRVIGMNSITIYVAQRIIDFRKASEFFLGGVAGLVPDLLGQIFVQVGYIAACWLFLWFLYRKSVFLKV